MNQQCQHEPVMESVGPMIHVTCVCGLDYWVPRRDGWRQR